MDFHRVNTLFEGIPTSVNAYIDRPKAEDTVRALLKSNLAPCVRDGRNVFRPARCPEILSH